jgi:hypothetical protein
MLKEAAVPDRGLGHGTVPKQPVASPVLAMLDELEINLGCSIALKVIKRIDQYQRNLDVPGPLRRFQDSEKDSRYYTIPAEPLDAHGREEPVLLFGVTTA